MCVCVCVCVCVACRARARGRWKGGVRMSGGICVCACEGNHHSSHQCSRPASISATAARPPGASGHRSPAVRGVSGEAGFDAVPGGGPPEPPHQSEERFLPSPSSSPPFSSSSISRESGSCRRCQPFKTE